LYCEGFGAEVNVVLVAAGLIVCTNTGEALVFVQTISPAASSTTSTSAPNPSQYNQTVVLSAKVRSATGAIPTGKVAFKEGTNTIGTVALTSGAASLSVSNLKVASHSIVAVYNASANFSGSTSLAITQIVNRASTTTTLTSTPNPSTRGTAVTFTATVLGAYGGTPSNTVTFKDGTTTIGSVVLSSTSHQVTFVISTLAVGTHNITATFVGGASFAPSTSAILKQVVQ